MKGKLILLMLFSVACFGQQKGDVILTWIDKSEISFGTYKVNVPQFKSENFSFNGSNNSIHYSLNLPQSSEIDENSLQITNVVFETISQSQLGDLNIKSIPNAINARIKTTIARDKIFAFLSLSPIIKDAEGFKKLLSFSYYFSNSSSSRSAIETNNTTLISNSVLASGDWYRFYIEKSGVYKISKSFLKQIGLNVNADPRNIKIYGNGGRMLPLLNSTYYPSDLA
jgi:hypothetical protein